MARGAVLLVCPETGALWCAGQRQIGPHNGLRIQWSGVACGWNGNRQEAAEGKTEEHESGETVHLVALKGEKVCRFGSLAATEPDWFD